MSLNSTTNRNDYTGDGASVTFAYQFLIFANTDLQVFVNGVLKTLTADYTVTGIGLAGGGNVIFNTPPPVSQPVTLLRVEPFTRTSNYVDNDPFAMSTLNNDLDKVTMLCQQLNERLGRTLSLATTSLFKNLLVPDPVAGKFLQWRDLTQLQNADVGSVGAVGLPLVTAQGGTGANYGTLAALAKGLGLSLWGGQAAGSISITPSANALTLPDPLTSNIVAVQGGNYTSFLPNTLLVGTLVVLYFAAGGNVVSPSATNLLYGNTSYTTSLGDIMVMLYVGGSSWIEILRVPAVQYGGVTTQPKFWRGDGTWVSLATTKGDIVVFGSALGRLPVGTDGQILASDSTVATGLKWITVTPGTDISVSSVSGSVTISRSSISPSFTSSDQTVTLSAALAVPHNLGAKPKLTQVTLKNATAEGGYSPGDEVIMSSSGAVNSGNVSPFSLAIDATNVTLAVGSAISLANKGTGANFAITAANWKWVVRAWA